MAGRTASGLKKLDKDVYEKELERLQAELVVLQEWVKHTGARVVVLFEGRDAAGKGGAIRRIADVLNPRQVRIAALPSPSARDKTQWYFQKYVAHLPAAGEIVLFDRSRGVRAFLDVRRELAARRFDVVLALQVYFKAGLVTAFTRAPVKLGFDRARARDALGRHAHDLTRHQLVSFAVRLLHRPGDEFVRGHAWGLGSGDRGHGLAPRP